MAYSLAQIAQKFSLACDGDTTLEPHGLCGLSDDLPDHLSFVTDRRLLETAASSKIPAFVTLSGLPVPGKANLFHDSPDYAISKIASLYARPSFTQHEQIAHSSVVDESATIAPTTTIGANVVIGAHTIIGERSILMAGTVILDRVTLGDDCVIYPNCVVREDSVLGDRVILQPGVAIGGDGFGYTKHNQQHVKTPQLGKVIIESDVEIGANSSIDRARFASTRIGRGTKIDNNVVIAHNVKVGECCIIVAQSGIAGSSRLGDNVVLAGQVGLAGHIKVGDNVTLLGQSMVTKDIREPGVWAGSPARPAKLWRRAIARLYAGVARG